jgi:hypothetical protein
MAILAARSACTRLEHWLDITASKNKQLLGYKKNGKKSTR